MKLPNTVIIIWWIIVTILISIAVGWRSTYFLEGNEENIDYLLIISWMTLIFVPLFSEIKIFGVDLKQKIDQVKSDIEEKINVLRNEIHISNYSQLNHTINLGPSLDDRGLSEMKEKINNIYNRLEGEKNFENRPEEYGNIDDGIKAPADAKWLFEVRFSIENELRRIATQFGIATRVINVPISKTLRHLLDIGVINAETYEALREIIGICNDAVHGKETTAAQNDFVKSVAPRMLRILKSIEG